jgi:hypothetical protein
MRETVLRLSVEELGEHLATLEEELSGGRSIELIRGERVIAEVRAPKEEATTVAAVRPQMPDFKARLREIWGDQPLDVDMTAVIREDRDARG